MLFDKDHRTLFRSVSILQLLWNKVARPLQLARRLSYTMKFSINSFYHVFNRGNNRQLIFLQQRNYDFFTSKLKAILSAHCKIVAYCLMPNHFHLLLYVDESSTGIKATSKPLLQILEQKLGTLQSSYTRAINNQEGTIGSLFQSKIKVIELDSDHASTCFHYIHQNPLKARLASDFTQWPYSSYNEYIAPTEGICCKQVAYEFLDIPVEPLSFAKLSKDVVINENVLAKISPQKSRLANSSGQATDLSL